MIFERILKISTASVVPASVEGQSSVGALYGKVTTNSSWADPVKSVIPPLGGSVVSFADQFLGGLDGTTT